MAHLSENTTKRRSFFPTVEARARTTLRLLGDSDSDRLTVPREHFVLGALGTYNPTSALRKV